MKDTYTKEEVTSIISDVIKWAEEHAGTYTKGQSDGYECWDIECVSVPSPTYSDIEQLLTAYQ